MPSEVPSGGKTREMEKDEEAVVLSGGKTSDIEKEELSEVLAELRRKVRTQYLNATATQSREDLCSWSISPDEVTSGN